MTTIHRCGLVLGLFVLGMAGCKKEQPAASEPAPAAASAPPAQARPTFLLPGEKIGGKVRLVTEATSFDRAVNKEMIVGDGIAVWMGDYRMLIIYMNDGSWTATERKAALNELLAGNLPAYDKPHLLLRIGKFVPAGTPRVPLEADITKMLDLMKGIGDPTPQEQAANLRMPPPSDLDRAAVGELIYREFGGLNTTQFFPIPAVKDDTAIADVSGPLTANGVVSIHLRSATPDPAETKPKTMYDIEAKLVVHHPALPPATARATQPAPK